MLNEKLLASNVLRRIYKDSTFEAAQLSAQWTPAVLAGNVEAAAARFFAESEAHAQTARLAREELTKRGEALR